MMIVFFYPVVSFSGEKVPRSNNHWHLQVDLSKLLAGSLCWHVPLQRQRVHSDVDSNTFPVTSLTCQTEWKPWHQHSLEWHLSKPRRDTTCTAAIGYPKTADNKRDVG